MKEESTVVRLRQPPMRSTIPLDRGPAQWRAASAVAQAVELEAQAVLAKMQELKRADGRDRLVRHGPERSIHTGTVPISRAKIRDRGACGADRIRFTAAIMPLWAARSLDALLPALDLRGVSTIAPDMAVGALGFWKAMDEVFPTTRHQPRA
ncbi:MAG: transposase [Rhodospirillaceae bacterium]|nr:MAG: transposase [Rhodospirillaceae bacterium]